MYFFDEKVTNKSEKLTILKNWGFENTEMKNINLYDPYYFHSNFDRAEK